MEVGLAMGMAFCISFWVAVDSHFHAHREAEVCPGLFEDVAQRKEAHRKCVVVGEHGEALRGASEC